METYTQPKAMVENPQYSEQRRRSLDSLVDGDIDKPLLSLIKGFNSLPYCFTLQCCYGHFIFDTQKDIHNLEPLPVTDTIAEVEYRIAYICFCIEKSAEGIRFMAALEKIAALNPDTIQFCSAEWFWKKQVNSYALQVEPERFKDTDRAFLDYREALHIEKIRNEFFIRLQELLQTHQR